MKNLSFLFIFFLAIVSCKNNEKNNNAEAIIDPPIENMDGGEAEDTSGLTINPIEHATMMLNWEGTIIYVDPVGGKDAFTANIEPDVILITDIHGDHMDAETVTSIIADKTILITPKAVADMLPEALKSRAEILNNGDKKTIAALNIEAIPMYNLRPEALKFHEKGRGNGYVLEKNGKRIYISGDTEDIPEMRSLQNIDIAFVCMNLPYTMTVEKAADAVLAFKPKTVYPYHYRGTEGLSDVSKFKALVAAGNADIKVTQLDWYPKRD